MAPIFLFSMILSNWIIHSRSRVNPSNLVQNLEMAYFYRNNLNCSGQFLGASVLIPYGSPGRKRCIWTDRICSRLHGALHAGAFLHNHSYIISQQFGSPTVPECFRPIRRCDNNDVKNICSEQMSIVFSSYCQMIAGRCCWVCGGLQECVWESTCRCRLSF